MLNLVFTDLGDYVLLESTDQNWSLPKNDTQVILDSNGLFHIHNNSRFVLNFLLGDVISPVHPTDTDLFDEISDWFNSPLSGLTPADLTGLNQETTQLDVLTELQLLNTSTGSGIPFQERVALGLVPKWSWVSKHGRKTNITHNQNQFIWNINSTFAFLAAAAVHEISSTNPDDTAAGTGARTVRVRGLDASYTAITEVVTLNGQTAVSTVNSYLRITSLSVITAGILRNNAGIIYCGTGTVTLGVNSIVSEIIPTGKSMSLSGILHVPDEHTFIAKEVVYSVNSENNTNNRPAAIEMLSRMETSGVTYAPMEIELRDSFGVTNCNIMSPVVGPASLYFTTLGLTNDNTVNVYVNLQGFLIDTSI